MSLVDIVKHALPMKLADGKRHVWPTLASMVYLKDGKTPLADEDGKITADNAKQLNGISADKFVQTDLEEAEDAGDTLLVNTDLLGGMTLAELDIYFEKLRLEREHPVGGQPYITFLPAEQDDPNVKWPWTSWTLDNEASGRFLLGANGTYPVGSTGGEATHTLTLDEMPRHDHSIPTYAAEGSDGSGWSTRAQNIYDPMQAIWISATGGNQPHNNIPPYLAVYMWKRTA